MPLTPKTYANLLTGPDLADPTWQTAAQADVHQLLLACAAEFASRCRAAPNHPQDSGRLPILQYGRGLGTDEAAAFLRALKAGLVTVDDDGHFLVPTARACSMNLHLVGRNEDHVAVHTEVLIHIGAYGELVLDGGWDPSRLVFDPFIRGAALDLWGYADEAVDSKQWWEGRMVFAAEAKARVTGADSLTLCWTPSSDSRPTRPRPSTPGSDGSGKNSSGSSATMVRSSCCSSPTKRAGGTGPSPAQVEWCSSRQARKRRHPPSTWPPDGASFRAAGRHPVTPWPEIGVSRLRRDEYGADGSPSTLGEMPMSRHSLAVMIDRHRLIDALGTRAGVSAAIEGYADGGGPIEDPEMLRCQAARDHCRVRVRP